MPMRHLMFPSPVVRFVARPFQKCRQFYVGLLCCALRRFAGRPMTSTGRSALIIAPHQDDETLGCGGLIALKRLAGTAVWVVFLTDGAAAEKPVPGLDHKDFVDLRKREALQALAVLSVVENSVVFLDIPDATLRNRRSAEIATERLSSLLATHRPEEVFTPHRHDRHPDHEAAWLITNAAIQRAGLHVDLFQYAVWLLWSAPLFGGLFRGHLTGARALCIRSVQRRKARAINAYASPCATLPRGFLAQFCRPFEMFFQSNTP